MKNHIKHVRCFVFVAIMQLMAIPVWAHDFEKDGIYYQITSRTEPYEVGVTNNNGNGNSYSGQVVIPNQVYYGGISYTVTSIIGNWVHGAFWNCTELVSVEIPNSVKSIGDFAFYICSGLTRINIPASVESIGQCAFGNCNGLVSVTASSGNPFFDSREDCNAIIETATNTLIVGCKSSVIPNSVTSIGDYAFYCCNSLINISIPNSVKSIGEQAFGFCEGLTSLSLPNSLISVGKGAFYCCRGINSIIIPNSVENINQMAFACGGVGFNSIVVDSENPVYDSRDNCNAIIETATNTLITGCKNTIIPNSITSIGPYAFSFCAGQFSMEMPNSVISIGEHAFRYSSIINITFSESLTNIGNDAFNHCSGLTSIDLPESLTLIGANAFTGCTSLNEVTIKAINPPICGGTPFPNYHIPIYVPCNSKEIYANANVWKDYANIYGTELLISLIVRSSDETIGSVRISQQPDCESHVATVLAEPIGNYSFLSWTVNGQVVSTANPYTFVVEEDIELVANFYGTGVDEETEQKVIVSPNPTKDFVNIACENMKGITLYTMNGRGSRTYELNTDAFILDMTSLPNGIYILRAETQEGVLINRKIIKE